MGGGVLVYDPSRPTCAFSPAFRRLVAPELQICPKAEASLRQAQSLP